jgi:hypothetical protein
MGTIVERPRPSRNGAGYKCEGSRLGENLEKGAGG